MQLSEWNCVNYLVGVARVSTCALQNNVEIYSVYYILTYVKRYLLFCK
jgi:hypothetical protein